MKKFFKRGILLKAKMELAVHYTFEKYLLMHNTVRINEGNIVLYTDTVPLRYCVNKHISEAPYPFSGMTGYESHPTNPDYTLFPPRKEFAILVLYDGKLLGCPLDGNNLELYGYKKLEHDLLIKTMFMKVG